MMNAWRLAVLAVAFVAATAGAATPWATQVVAYDYDGDGDPTNDGVTPTVPAGTTYNNPATALGAATRMTGVGSDWPGVVSVFSPAWEDTHVVSIAPGGYLVLGFDTPIVDGAAHLYGVDLIVFGNASFNDDAWPSGIIAGPASLLLERVPSGEWVQEKALIELSVDGSEWFLVPGVWGDYLFPTQGYLDSGPYDRTPGAVPTNFLKPVNPALTLSDFDGLTHAQILALYDGSGGGTPVDIAAAGLTEANFVRISVPEGAAYTVEVDAVAVVPEPTSLVLLAGAIAGVCRRRRNAA